MRPGGERKGSASGLLFLSSDRLFGVYVEQMPWAQSYAWNNPKLILNALLGVMRDLLGRPPSVEGHQLSSQLCGPGAT